MNPHKSISTNPLPEKGLQQLLHGYRIGFYFFIAALVSLYVYHRSIWATLSTIPLLTACGFLNIAQLIRYFRSEGMFTAKRMLTKSILYREIVLLLALSAVFLLPLPVNAGFIFATMFALPVSITYIVYFKINLDRYLDSTAPRNQEPEFICESIYPLLKYKKSRFNNQLKQQQKKLERQSLLLFSLLLCFLFSIFALTLFDIKPGYLFYLLTGSVLLLYLVILSWVRIKKSWRKYRQLDEAFKREMHYRFWLKKPDPGILYFNRY